MGAAQARGNEAAGEGDDQRDVDGCDEAGLVGWIPPPYRGLESDGGGAATPR